MFKNGKFRHVSESKWNLKRFFKPKFKPKFCLLNRLPVDLSVLADEVGELGDLVEGVDVGHPVEVEVVGPHLLPQVAPLQRQRKHRVENRSGGTF